MPDTEYDHLVLEGTVSTGTVTTIPSVSAETMEAKPKQEMQNVFLELEETVATPITTVTTTPDPGIKYVYLVLEGDSLVLKFE
ncbi:hypothetical protein Aduo_019493 [Ancylostoma duodenale]